MADPAYDGGTFLKTYLVRLLEADDPRRALHRGLDVFAEVTSWFCATSA